MIDCITIANEQYFPGLRRQIHAFRHQEFSLKWNYNTSQYQGMEFDDYDTPATVSLVYRGSSGQVEGMSRLFPTIFPHMLEQIWHGYVTKKPLPKGPTIWESSRMAVTTRDAQLKQRVISELIIAHCEFALHHQIASFVGIMPEKIFHKVWTDRGWAFEKLGEPGADGVAGELPVTADLLGRLRKNCGMVHSILNYPVVVETL